MKIMRRNLKDFIKEIIPIVVGILIALWINNWNENRKDKNYIDKISISINKELLETNEDIIKTKILQKSMLDTIDYYLKDSEISILNIVTKSNGLYVPGIKINTLKTLSNSKIELMEYEKISGLANVEQQKNILEAKTERCSDFLYANPKEKTEEKKEFMKLLLLDIIGSETVLQKSIGDIIKN